MTLLVITENGKITVNSQNESEEFSRCFDLIFLCWPSVDTEAERSSVDRNVFGGEF